MIAQIYGQVTAREKGSLILKAGALSYRVHVPLLTYEGSSPNAPGEIMLWTHLAIRENSQELYGFESKEELDFFELLISISGIGPKSALGILNLADVRTLTTAIASGDSSYLTKVSGIGKKSAEKIILELRDKLGAFESTAQSPALKEEAETIEALQALGYGLRESREALRMVEADSESTGDLIKAALKVLSKSR